MESLLHFRTGRACEVDRTYWFLLRPSVIATSTPRLGQPELASQNCTIGRRPGSPLLSLFVPEAVRCRIVRQPFPVVDVGMRSKESANAEGRDASEPMSLFDATLTPVGNVDDGKRRSNVGSIVGLGVGEVVGRTGASVGMAEGDDVAKQKVDPIAEM